MSMQYDAERLAELQTVLVTEYLELVADTDCEPNPDALRACAMLLAGAAELADPPSPTPAPADDVFEVRDPKINYPSESVIERDTSSDMDALLQPGDQEDDDIEISIFDTPPDSILTSTERAERNALMGLSPDAAPESIVVEETPPPTCKTPAEYLRSLNETTLPRGDYEQALEHIDFVRDILKLVVESSRHIEKSTMKRCEFQLYMAKSYLDKNNDQCDL